MSGRAHEDRSTRPRPAVLVALLLSAAALVATSQPPEPVTIEQRVLGQVFVSGGETAERELRIRLDPEAGRPGGMPLRHGRRQYRRETSSLHSEGAPVSASQRHLVVGLVVAVAALLLAVAVLNAMLPDVGSGQTIGQCRSGETPSRHLCYEPG